MTVTSVRGFPMGSQSSQADYWDGFLPRSLVLGRASQYTMVINLFVYIYIYVCVYILPTYYNIYIYNIV